MDRKSGFTLIELLVVIAILGILSTIAVAVYSGITVKARDAQRMKDLQTIKQALELYRGDVHKYPLTEEFVLSTPNMTLSSAPNIYLFPIPKDLDPNRRYFYASNGSEFILCARKEGRDSSNDLFNCSKIDGAVPAGSCGGLNSDRCDIGIISQ